MNDWFPMDKEQSALQVEAVLSELGPKPKDIVDVGCGDGRLLIPMALAGHNVVGIDVDPNAISACASNCVDADVHAELIDGSLFDIFPLVEPVDAICCCGQTFMLISDVYEAVDALKLFRASLKDKGIVIIDDIPGDLWPEVADGGWINGVNSDESLQFLWCNNDAVFAIREGEQVDSNQWEFTENDRPIRLWTMGALKLVAHIADLSAPTVPVKGAILVMRAI
jgi:SAM-dependent methyltransferase